MFLGTRWPCRDAQSHGASPANLNCRQTNSDAAPKGQRRRLPADSPGERYCWSAFEPRTLTLSRTVPALSFDIHAPAAAAMCITVWILRKSSSVILLHLRSMIGEVRCDAQMAPLFPSHDMREWCWCGLPVEGLRNLCAFGAWLFSQNSAGMIRVGTRPILWICRSGATQAGGRRVRSACLLGITYYVIRNKFLVDMAFQSGMLHCQRGSNHDREVRRCKQSCADRGSAAGCLLFPNAERGIGAQRVQHRVVDLRRLDALALCPADRHREEVGGQIRHQDQYRASKRLCRIGESVHRRQIRRRDGHQHGRPHDPCRRGQGHQCHHRRRLFERQ